MWFVSDLTPTGVALIWPTPALDPDGLWRTIATLIVACVLAPLPSSWGPVATATLVAVLVFFALR